MPGHDPHAGRRPAGEPDACVPERDAALGKIGKQKIEDAGELCPFNLEALTAQLDKARAAHGQQICPATRLRAALSLGERGVFMDRAPV